MVDSRHEHSNGSGDDSGFPGADAAWGPRRFGRVPPWLWIWTALLVAVLVTVPIVASPSADAVRTGSIFSRQYGEQINGISFHYATGASLPVWLGSFRAGSAMGSTYAWCVQGDTAVPTSAGKSRDLRAPEISYVINRWGTQNYGAHGRNVTHAAVSYLVHSKLDVGSVRHSSDVQRARYVKNVRPGIKAVADAMWGAATRLAGPYTASATLTRGAGEANAATLSGVGVRSAAGNWVPGAGVTVTLSGPVTFNSGAKTHTFVSTDAPFSRSNLIITGPGTVRASVKVTGLAGVNVTQWSGSDNTFGRSGTAQDMITPQPASVRVARQISVSPVEPEIGTVASAISASSTVLTHRDTVSVNAPARFAGERVTLHAWLRYHGTSAPAWVPVTSRASIPGQAAASQITTTVTLNENGNATWTPQATSSVRAGYYTWVVANDSALGGLLSATISDYGIPAETRQWSANPEIVTTASQDAPTAANQVTVRDRIEGTGFIPGTAVTYQARLYQHPDGVSWPTSPVTEAAALAFGATQVGPTATATVTANTSGVAVANVSRVVSQRAVDTRYTWVIQVLPIAGQLPAGYLSRYAIPEESVLVPPTAPGHPLVSTVASDQVAAPGDTISDTFIINRQEADLDDYPLVITSRLWHVTELPVFNADIADQVGGAALVSTEVLDPIGDMDDEIERTGQHEFTLPTDSSAAGGWWIYTYCYAATGHWADGTLPNDRVLGYEGHCDTTVYTPETVHVPWRLTVSTAATPALDAPGSVGDTVADRVGVTGGKPGSVVTVVLRTYEPVRTAPAVRTLTDADRPTTGPTETVEVHLDANGSGTAMADGFAATDPGYYPWTETVTHAAEGTTGLGVESDYGIAGELALIKLVPTVTTMASHQITTAGTLLTDQFTVTGLPAGETVTVTHTGYCSDTAPELSASIPAGERRVGQVTSTVTADEQGEVGLSVSPHIVAPTQCPFFVWTESIREGDLYEGWQSDYGIASEVTGVVSVITRANPYAQVGTTTYDLAEVHGPAPAGSVLYFDYYRQVEGDDPSADELIGTVGPVAVDGPGTYTSPTIDVSEAVGLEYFRERLYVPTPDGIIDLDSPPLITGEPRLPNETTAIVNVTSTATRVARPGQAFTDTVHLDVPGELPAGSTISWELWEQTGAKDAPLTETGYEGDTLVKVIGPVKVTDADDYLSPHVRVKNATRVYWVERLHVPGRTAPIATGAYRLANETTTITDAPGITDKPEPDKPGLPQTGARLAWVLTAGIAIAAIGGGLILVRRRLA